MEKTQKTDTKSEDILKKARQQVDRLLEQTAKDVQEQIDGAQKLGVRRGYQQAEQLRQKLKQYEETIMNEVDGEIVRAALSVATQILRHEVLTKNATTRIIRNALDSVKDSKTVSIRVNPTNEEEVKLHKEKLLDVLSRAKDLDIRADRQVEIGGVVIQTESGVIDAQPSTQLEEIKNAIEI